jgi:hypothetical protein
MATIHLNPLIDALGGQSATGATGTATAVAMYQGKPSTRIQGAGVILPAPVTVSFTNGVLADTLELDVLPEGNYWKFTIVIDELHHIYYFTIPAEATYDFNELTFIDPVSYVAISPVEFPEPVAFSPAISNLTGEAATGTYIKYGRMVYVSVNVSLGSVTNFGGGTQYSLTLPFAAAAHQDTFAGSVHDVGVTTSHWSLKCHLSASSTTASIWFLERSGGTSILDTQFTSAAPFTLTTADQFHLAFWYESEA